MFFGVIAADFRYIRWEFEDCLQDERRDCRLTVSWVDYRFSAGANCTGAVYYWLPTHVTRSRDFKFKFIIISVL